MALHISEGGVGGGVVKNTIFKAKSIAILRLWGSKVTSSSPPLRPLYDDWNHRMEIR